MSTHPSESLRMEKLSDFLKRSGVNPAASRLDTYGADEMATFNRYGVTYADDEISSTLGYVFIVRPDLNLIESGTSLEDIELTAQCGADMFLVYLAATDPLLIACLTQTPLGNYTHHFIPFLYDRVEEYQIPDFEISTHEMTQPFTGFTTVYAGNSNAFLSKSQFSISFRDSATLRVTKLFQAWLSYINGITLNLFAPKEEYTRSKYTQGTQVIDYATSVYYIKTKPDGEIIYFHKTTGAVPTQVPLSSQSYNRGGTSDNRVSIQFVGGYPESMNLATLAEFNYNSLGSFSGSKVPLAADYDFSGIGGLGYSGDLMTSSPVIVTDTTASRHRKFYLCWRKSSYNTTRELTEYNAATAYGNKYGDNSDLTESFTQISGAMTKLAAMGSAFNNRNRR